ncbi:MAG: CaiB/BaiF CoA transferase family protein [Brevibacterium yomogidense]
MTGERISNGEATGASATGSLGGITVVDLSRVLGGPYATQMLGDHGARVLKIEPPQGDETRAWGPPFYRNGIAWYYAGVNRNKEVRTLDLRTDAGQAQLRALLAEADVLVENFKPGTLEKWGLGYDVLSVEFPRLVHCSVTGFGEDGPLGGMPGYDAVAQAMSGLMSVNGTPESGPTRIGMPAVDMITGLNAVNGIMMALWERGASGRGQRVETTLFDCALSVMHPHMPNFFGTGQPAARTGNDHPNIAPYSTYATGEGDLFIAVGNDRVKSRVVV